MNESKELNRIKKLYGERFMRLCRNLFPTLLEQEGMLTEILTSKFPNNGRTLFEDITKNQLEEVFRTYVYNQLDIDMKKTRVFTGKTPYQLLQDAGYDLYECHTEREIQSFKRYYKPREELCTFQGGRLNSCVVFWAIKKGAEKLKREDFKEPKRQDEYGTSVLGIQFSKIGKCTVSIKNRYNHTVSNPDATYGNNLDKIIPGLTQSFADLLLNRGLTLENSNIENFRIPSYTIASDGKYYKYNMEMNGVYYCPGNIVIKYGNVEKLEPEKKVLIDYFILDKENKTLKLYDERINDSFINDFECIEKIEMRRNTKKRKGGRTITIKNKSYDKPIIIEIDKDNRIKEYENDSIIQTGYGFLIYNKELSKLHMENLKNAGDNFLAYNRELSELYVPNLVKAGNNFLFFNRKLTELYAPSLKEIRQGFLEYNEKLSKLYAPNLRLSDKCTIIGEFLVNLIKTNKYEDEQKLYVEPKDIANLDKENKVTESEINHVKRIFGTIKSIFKWNDGKSR